MLLLLPVDSFIFVFAYLMAGMNSVSFYRHFFFSFQLPLCHQKPKAIYPVNVGDCQTFNGHVKCNGNGYTKKTPKMVLICSCCMSVVASEAFF